MPPNSIEWINQITIDLLEGFPGGSDGEESACNVGDLGSIPELERSPGGGHNYPLQYSCPENPHGQRSLVGYSLWGHKELDTIELLSSSSSTRLIGKSSRPSPLTYAKPFLPFMWAEFSHPALPSHSWHCIGGFVRSSKQAWPHEAPPSGDAAAAAAKLLQSCPTLCDPIGRSPPGPSSLGFSRQEHWSGVPFPSPMHESETWKWSRSVVSDSSRSHGLQPTRLLGP